MATLTLRPNTTIQNGVWTKVPSGGTVAGILSDNSDLTYIYTNVRNMTPGQVAVVDFPDIAAGVDLPTGAKINNLRFRTRAYQVTPPSGSSFSYEPVRFYCQLVETVVHDIVTGQYDQLFRHIFGWQAPIQPATAGSPTWVTTELVAFPDRPSGGEWTIEAINNLKAYLGRSDGNPYAVPAKLGELYMDIDYNEQPEVDVTGPTTPVEDTTRPVITWDYTDPEDDPQAAYRVKVFTEAQYTASTFAIESTVPFAEVDWTAGEDEQWLCSRDLANGTYRAYVQVRQLWRGIGEHRSEWEYHEWVQDVPGPPAPVITPTVNTTVNWVQLDLAPSDDDPATETYNVEYSDDSGLTWQLIRGGFQIAADASMNATVYDYEAPLNQARWYRAAGFRTLGSVRVSGDYSDVVTATPFSTKFWLKDPLSPSLNMRITVYDDKPKQQRAQGVFSPLAAAGTTTFKVVVSGPRYGIEGDMVLVFVGNDADSGFDDFNAIYESGRTLLLQYPTGEQHYVRLGADVSQEWGLQSTKVQYRKVTISYYEVVKPVDPTVPT